MRFTEYKSRVLTNPHLRQRVTELVSTLYPRQEYVLRCLYDLSQEEAKGPGVLARAMRISRQRLDQIRNKAEARLKHPGRLRFFKKIPKEMVDMQKEDFEALVMFDGESLIIRFPNESFGVFTAAQTKKALQTGERLGQGRFVKLREQARRYGEIDDSLKIDYSQFARMPQEGRGSRNLLCPIYDKCLDEAIEEEWKTFNCDDRCPLRHVEGEGQKTSVLGPLALVNRVLAEK